jgi:PadR family transcriptional regulator, regulatory protein PadR
MRRPSAQTVLVLAALRDAAPEWRHGYELARATGLKSGSLYPILARLGARGLVESSWEEPAPTGRPRRRLHRLTAEGRAAAVEATARPFRPESAWSA